MALAEAVAIKFAYNSSTIVDSEKFSGIFESREKSSGMHNERKFRVGEKKMEKQIWLSFSHFVHFPIFCRSRISLMDFRRPPNCNLVFRTAFLLFPAIFSSNNRINGKWNYEILNVDWQNVKTDCSFPICSQK